MSRSLKAHILLILVTFVWGATFVQIKDALNDITPLLFNAVRMAVAAAVLALIYRKHIPTMRRPAMKAGLLVGVFLTLGYEFQTAGLNLTTPSKAGFITGLYVVLVPIFLVLFWRRKIKTWTAVGVLSALVGLYLLTVPSGSGWGGNFTGANRGDLLILICAVAFAFHIILLGRAAQRYAFEQIALVQVATSAVLMLLVTPLLERPQVIWSAKVVWAIAVTGILATSVAFAIQTWVQQFLPPTNTALIFSLEPVFAWLTSYVVLGERLGARAVVGAILILAGVLASEILGGTNEAQAPAG
ncbi:MAG: DMT family transporter [Acidobacteriales bacterium]|nr:DMT family transporter [Terriglobales bacterium]